MKNNHTLDRSKIEAELTKRGWKRGRYGEWLIPDSTGFKNIEEDWTAAVLCGIVCELEILREDNLEFIKKHRTKGRKSYG